MKDVRVIGNRILRFKVIDSTNEKAKELLDEAVDEGTVVVAESQAAGRGRYGRAWFSPRGGLYLSIILRPKERNVQLLSLLSGLPVVKAASAWSVNPVLKWPNDILVGGKKLGGILCEGVYRHNSFYAIVGIGVNTANDLSRLPEEIRATATSLKLETGKQIDNEDFLDHLCRQYEAFHDRYVAGETERLVQEYRQLCSTLGKTVTVETAKGKVKGRAVDVSPLGALIVESGGKRVEVYEGTVLDATTASH